MLNMWRESGQEISFSKVEINKVERLSSISLKISTRNRSLIVLIILGFSCFESNLEIILRVIYTFIFLKILCELLAWTFKTLYNLEGIHVWFRFPVTPSRVLYCQLWLTCYSLKKSLHYSTTESLSYPPIPGSYKLVHSSEWWLSLCIQYLTQSKCQLIFVE
jgi:hypothetical protein